MPARPVCAYCRQQPSDAKYQPFCSERCKMADLGRWLQGDYRICDPIESSSDVSTLDEDDEGQP